MNEYLICILTSFLGLTYFTIQQVSYRSVLLCSVNYSYYLLNVDNHLVARAFIDCLLLLVLLPFWLTDISLHLFGKILMISSQRLLSSWKILLGRCS